MSENRSDAPLREDIRQLGGLLGSTIHEQSGAHVYETVEEIRGLAKSARAGDEAAARALEKRLGELPDELIVPVVRAFSQFLNLANIAEQHHRIRRSRAWVWETDEIRRRRPAPQDEARWGLAVIEQTLWDVVPHFLRRLDRNLKRQTGTPLALDSAPIHFGSWMGGDRDGNPRVTATVTREVCLLNRWKAVELYEQQINALIEDLSLQCASDELRGWVGDAWEPYRTALKAVRDRLLATRHWLEARLAGRQPTDGLIYWRTEELREPLMICYRSLHESGAGMIAEGRLKDLLRRLSVFGLTLMRVDIRQESTRHTDALNALTEALGIGSYAEPRALYHRGGRGDAGAAESARKGLA